MKPQLEKPKLKMAGDVIAALRDRYPKDAYAFLEQVGNSTGYSGTRRWCDALVMSLWPSRGLEIIGIEVKVSRSDWVSELENPAKAEAVAKHCDRWYLAVGDESIVREGELPKTWGLMVPVKAGGGVALRIRTEATLNLPEPGIDRPFLAAVLRRAQEQVTDEAKMRAEYERGRTEGINSRESSKDGEIKRLKDSLETKDKRIRDFEVASGLNINQSWTSQEKIGEAVRIVMSGDDKIRRIQGEFEALLERAERITAGLRTEVNGNGDMPERVKALLQVKA